MLDAPPVDKRSEPKTLFEARQLHRKDQETIARLQAQLGGKSPPGGALIPKTPSDVPIFLAPITPINPSSLAPKALAAHMEDLSDSELHKFLRKEPSDTAGYNACYAEICKRRRRKP
jgi:hypothetical protein